MDRNRSIVDIVNKALEIEYCSIYYYHCIARLISDNGVAQLFLEVGSDSVRLAERGAKMVRSLGGDPLPSLFGGVRAPPTDETDIIPLLHKLYEAERTAAQLYREAAELTDLAEFKTFLLSEVEEEERHARVVKDVLARITRVTNQDQ